MSESKDENKDDSTVDIPDDQLPDDLVPSEDNPLAEGLPDGETVGDLLHEGKQPDGAEQTRSGGASAEDSDD